MRMSDFNDFDVLLSNGRRVFLTFNVFNPSCFSHVSIFYKNEVFDFHRDGPRRLTVETFYKKNQTVLVLRPKQTQSSDFSEYYQKTVEVGTQYGFWGENTTYCFKWIADFFNERNRERILPTWFNYYYDAKSFLDSYLFDSILLLSLD